MEDASSSHQTSAIPQMRFGKIDDLSSRVAAAIGGARDYLFSQQHEEGYWCGELEADTTLESDYIMLHTLLGTGDVQRFQKAARYILQHQNEDGGWPIYAGGPSNVSASVKAYFGLKLAGFTADHSALVRARKKILELGGVTEVNTFTKIYLCFFGQYDYDAVPAIPPEIVLKKAERWVLERFEMSDGFGAIYRSMLNAIVALRCLGYSLDDPQVIRAIDEFEKLGIEEAETFRMQPCKPPVWDAAYALFALGESGVPASDPRIVKCADWILQKQVRTVGDWKVKNRKGQPGGWYFEFNNEFYPDVDDSAMVCLALTHVEHPNGRYQRESVQRAIDWIFSMQCRNGGWASFDKNNDRMVFQHIPFADHNAMLDPPTVDITGRILEMLAAYGYDKNHPAVKKALKFIREEQEPDGSWFGRWGVNYMYGTALVLRGLEAVGVDHHEPYVQQAAEWLRMVQNPDGGWGETCDSYDDPNRKGIGESTASQTAWAVLGLMAANDIRSDSVARGIAYLLRTQQKDGSWDENYYTGTGFPRVFYLKYHMYRQYFPLLALTTYAKMVAEESASSAGNGH